MTKVKILLIISVLVFALYMILSLDNKQEMNQYPSNAIRISSPDLSETATDEFVEVDTKIPSHPASFDSFQPVDVDEDGIKEKIYYVPTAMNHGAAEIWIIKDDLVIFKSKEVANRWFEPSDNNNGFYLIEGLQVDNEWNAISKKTRYTYQDKKFVPVWYQEEKN